MLKEEKSEIESEIESRLNFRKRVDEWDKNREHPYEDRRKAAFEFALEILEADPSTAQKFVYRDNIKWDIIKSYTSFGKMVRCKICGNTDYGDYWCKPCIHKDWCCECCTLLGHPFYSSGMYILVKVQCLKCGYEWQGFKGGSTSNLGLGLKLTKSEPLICPKCGAPPPTTPDSAPTQT